MALALRTNPKVKAKKTPSEVISLVRSGSRIFIHGAAATPHTLIRELIRQSERLRDLELIHLHTEGSADYALSELKNVFKITNLFIGKNIRPHFDYDQVDYLPCLLSEIPSLFRSRLRPIDIAFISLSPPNAHGYHTLGTSIDVARSATDVARTILAQVNLKLPQTHGDTYLHHSPVAAYCEVDDALPEVRAPEEDPVDKAIGKNVASLIDDGSCIQAGIGGIPNSVLSSLQNHQNLGIHSEMASDQMINLIHSGAVNNSKKKNHRGKTALSFAFGTKKLYQMVHDHPGFVFLPSDIINHPKTIAENPKAIAINSALAIDLTGQVCADSVGHRMISGVGGQLDFMQGVTYSPGGKSILALTSRCKQTNRSRIVAELPPGSGVVTTRAQVEYICTEYGVAQLRGRTLSERAIQLIKIAHPEDRESLEQEWRSLVKNPFKRT